jgi:hypothetical protein
VELMATERKNPRGCMRLEEIAETLNISTATANRVFNRAISKLRKQSGAYEGLLFCVQAVAARNQTPLRASSVECRADWIEKYGLLFQLSISSYYVGYFRESL